MNRIAQEVAVKIIATWLAFCLLGFGIGWYAHKAPSCPPPAIAPATTLEVETQHSLDFAASIKKGIAANPHIRPAMAKKILAILDGPESFKKSVVLRTLERHAKAHLMEQHLTIGAGATVESFDWSKVNWSLVLDTVIKVLMLILSVI